MRVSVDRSRGNVKPIINIVIFDYGRRRGRELYDGRCIVSLRSMGMLRSKAFTIYGVPLQLFVDDARKKIPNYPFSKVDFEDASARPCAILSVQKGMDTII